VFGVSYIDLDKHMMHLDHKKIFLYRTEHQVYAVSSHGKPVLLCFYDSFLVFPNYKIY